VDFNLLLRAKPYVAEHLKKDFAAFCRAAWPHLHPGSKLSWTPAHDLICEYLVSVHRGDLKRLIINCPPRFSKSTIANVCFPVWVWLQDPKKSFLCTSYEIDLALNMNLDRRRLMDSKWFRDLFGDVFTLSTDRAQAGDFSNTAGGQMQAASVNSKAQGRGGDIIVVDDPLSADFAYSESFRNETNAWFTNQLPQRLNNPSESAIIVIAQRLHQNDPCGFLLGQEDTEWTLLKLPLIAERDETITFPLSGRVWRRPKGSCLDPKRWSPRTVRERQRDRLTFASQFMQEPMAAEGNLIRTDDILYFGGRDPQTGMMDPGLPETFERKIISVDCSFKDKAGSDYVAIIVVGVVGSRRYLLHVVNARLDLTGSMNEIRNARAAYGPISATLIEDKANGSSVIAHLKEEIPGVIAVDPQGGKMSRVVATAPEFRRITGSSSGMVRGRTRLLSSSRCFRTRRMTIFATASLNARSGCKATRRNMVCSTTASSSPRASPKAFVILGAGWFTSRSPHQNLQRHARPPRRKSRSRRRRDSSRSRNSSRVRIGIASPLPASDSGHQTQSIAINAARILMWLATFSVCRRLRLTMFARTGPTLVRRTP
jgi:hypothetical protein